MLKLGIEWLFRISSFFCCALAVWVVIKGIKLGDALIVAFALASFVAFCLVLAISFNYDRRYY